MGDYKRWHDGQIAWEAEDGTIVYSASGIGYCFPELVWSRRGIQAQAPPGWLEKAFEDGKREESKILDAVAKTLGVAIDGYRSGEQRGGIVRINSTVVIQWHIDGLELGGNRPVEAKLLASSNLKPVQTPGNKLFEQYMDQMTVYSFAHGKANVLWALGEKDKEGNFLRLADVLECTWEDDFASRWPKIKTKIIEVEKAVRDNTEVKCEDPSRFPCMYLFMRPDHKEEKAAKDKEKRTQLKDRKLIQVAEEYVTALDREKVFKEAKEQAGRELHELVNKEAGEPEDETRYFSTPNGWGLTEVKVPDQTNWEAVWKFVEGHGGKKSDFLVPSGKTYFRISIPKMPGGSSE